MSIVMLIICLVSGGLSFIFFLFNLRKPTELRRRVTYVISVILLFTTITSGALSYWASIETEEQLQLAHTQASEASEQADRAQAQVIEIRTPRRMEPETERILFAKLKPYAGQKYDMKVFRDQDSLELAPAIQAILEEAGWVYTNVYPKHATRYAETRGKGVFIISGKVETIRTSEAKKALRGALTEAGLYNDSDAFIPMNCAESTALPQVGDKITPIPCSDSPIKSIKIDFTVHDDVIPEDTLVLHVGKERL